jgi:peptide/nickel transport system substrate-binding protein
MTSKRRESLSLALLTCAAVCHAGCVRDRPPLPAGTLTVSVEQQASWVRNFNPLAPPGSQRWPAMGGVYEPLILFNTATGKYVPWLSDTQEWRDGGHILHMHIRENVLWSDGQPFGADDVVFTFQLLKKIPALDRAGVWTFLSDVRKAAPDAVDFIFSRVYYPGLDDLAPQPIVPEHIWSKLENPLTYTDENPVATGPFTEVRFFQTQVFELGKNPHYWQPGKPMIDALRMPALPSNERANLGLVFDEIDWAGNFVPAIDRVFKSKNPNHGYWFPLTGTTVFLYANTARKPFDDVRVRRAISLAIDRTLLIQVALYGYSRPSDNTALSDQYATWREASVTAKNDWVLYDRAKAEALLDSAGLKRGEDGLRRDSSGKPIHYEVLTVSGWSDWVRAAQVIARNLREAGIDAQVRTYDFSAWYERLQEGNFDLSLGWSVEGPTPYTFYRWLMSSKTVRPIGTPAIGNWPRYGSPAADTLLSAFELEPDEAAQRKLVAGLEQVFADEAPAIPLYPNPSWGEFNSSRFDGFPDAQHPYADLSPNKTPQTLFVLTTLSPKKPKP